MEDVNKDVSTATNEAETVVSNESASPVETASPVESQEPVSTRDALRTALQGSKPPAEPTAPAAEPTNDVARDPISGKELEKINAPGSWSPKLRQKWGSIDREAQKFIADRDKHIQQVLTETAEARSFAKKFREVAEPYAKQFPRGTDAAEVAGQLFKIDHSIRNGSQAERAQMIFRIMQQANPDMTVLNQLMQQYAPRQVIHPAPGPQNIDAEVQRRINEEAAKVQQQSQREELDKLFAEFEANPDYEFINSEVIRQQMGRALQSELVGGKDDREAIVNAYEFVKRNNPELQAIYAARAQAAQPQVTAPSQPQAAKPAVRPVGSVAPSLGGGAAKPATRVDSTKEAMRLAMRAAGRKV